MLAVMKGTKVWSDLGSPDCRVQVEPQPSMIPSLKERVASFLFLSGETQAFTADLCICLPGFTGEFS